MRPIAASRSATPSAVRTTCCTSSPRPRGARDEHPAERAGDGPHAQPLHQPEMHRAPAQVNEGADRLHDRARHQVGRHRRERRDVKEQHQHRSHEGTTAHPGESHDDPDAKRGEGKKRIQTQGRSSGRRKQGRQSTDVNLDDTHRTSGESNRTRVTITTTPTRSSASPQRIMRPSGM